VTGLGKGLALAAIQVALILSLGAKLLYDRATQPRVWALVETYDPDLPIRGRYLAESLRVPAEGFQYKEPGENNAFERSVNEQTARLEIRDGKLIATPDPNAAERFYVHRNPDGSLVAIGEDPVLIFIPENAKVPALKPREEMWVEVTLPKEGPPRPIRAGIKKDGQITPLTF
jgi:hypothetical protein